MIVEGRPAAAVAAEFGISPRRAQKLADAVTAWHCAQFQNGVAMRVEHTLVLRKMAREAAESWEASRDQDRRARKIIKERTDAEGGLAGGETTTESATADRYGDPALADLCDRLLLSIRKIWGHQAADAGAAADGFNLAALLGTVNSAAPAAAHPTAYDNVLDIRSECERLLGERKGRDK